MNAFLSFNINVALFLHNFIDHFIAFFRHLFNTKLDAYNTDCRYLDTDYGAHMDFKYTHATILFPYRNVNQIGQIRYIISDLSHQFYDLITPIDQNYKKGLPVKKFNT